MKISRLHIRNLRSLKDCEFELGDFVSFVGANGAGKSTVLHALNVFFRHIDSPTSVSELDREDFFNRDVSNPIEITVTFSELNDEAQKAFAAYYRHDRLVITAKAFFDEDTQVAVVKQYGQRLVMSDFATFFEMYDDGHLVAELKTEFARIRQSFSDVKSSSTKSGMRDELRAYENAHVELCGLVPSEDQFYGFSKGANLLADFVQWVYIPAVKDATKEISEAKNTALGQILARTVRTKVDFGADLADLKDEVVERYRSIIAEQQASLDELSASLTGRLNQWAHPGVKARLAWGDDGYRSVQVHEPVAKLLATENSFEGELARFGHGLQRSYLLALLQELALVKSDKEPTLILGVEEPELYQHPPQARHLAQVLQELSEGNSQVLVSTHSPLFVSGRFFESVRLVRRRYTDGTSTVHYTRFKSICERLSWANGKQENGVTAEAARLHQSLQPHVNEMFFSPTIVFVEGREDLAYIMSCMILTKKAAAFRRGGGNIIPVVYKSSIVEPLIIAQSLEIPVFVIFDADGDKIKPSERALHESDNKTLLKLLGGDENVPFPGDIIWHERFIQWPTNIGKCLRQECGEGDWDSERHKVAGDLGNPEGHYSKNSVHIGMHMERLHSLGKLPPSLVRVCDTIIDFCSKT